MGVLVDILRVVAGIVLFLYGLLCVWMGVTRQGSGIATINMISIPALFAILLGVMPSFRGFVTENFDTTMTLVLVVFVGSGIIASVSDMEVIPGLVNGFGIIGLAIWISGVFPQAVVSTIVMAVSRVVLIFFIPFFVVVLFVRWLFH